MVDTNTTVRDSSDKYNLYDSNLLRVHKRTVGALKTKFFEITCKIRLDFRSFADQRLVIKPNVKLTMISLTTCQLTPIAD